MEKKPIGLHFAAELEAAGVLKLPFAWGADGQFSFSPAMTEEQVAAVLAVYAAHDADAVLPTP